MKRLIAEPIAGLRGRLRSIARAVRETRHGDDATKLPAAQIDATPRDGVVTARPEWEYVREGWNFARDEAEPCSRGWDVEQVALTYSEHWPAFRSAIAGPKPLGVAHELAYGRAMSNNSLVAHNTALTLAYVLARATRSADSLSVLDWGGGLGYQHAIAQSGAARGAIRLAHARTARGLSRRTSGLPIYLVPRKR
jgi:hypothetical protein